MAKISVLDDCMVSDKYVRLKYSGPNPWGMADFLNDNLKSFFHVSSSKVNNYRINWDVTGDPVSFYARWWVRKEVSRHTLIRVVFKLVGNKGKVRNEGDFSLSIWGKVETDFRGWGPLLKPAWALYSYLFFNRVRRKYIEQCQNYMLTFTKMVKEHFNVESTTVPMSRGFG